jgi:hypothetical protein
MTTDLVQLHTPEARLVELMRHATAILLSSLVAGVLVGGIGSRLFMLVARLIAPERRGAITDAGNRVGEVTMEGTVGLVVFIGLITAIAVGVTMAATSPWLSWTGRFGGVALGVVLLLVFSPTILDPDNLDFFLLGDQMITVIMIVVLFIASGVVAVAVCARLIRWLPMRTSLTGHGAPYIPAGVLGVLGTVILAGAITAPGEDGTIAFDLVSFLFILMLVVAIADQLLWVLRGAKSPTVIRLAGYAVLGTVTIVGSVRLISDISEILG